MACMTWRATRDDRSGCGLRMVNRIISLTVSDLRRKSGIEKQAVKGQSLQLKIGGRRESKLL